MASEASLELLEDWEEWNPESGTSFYVHAFAGSLAGAAEHCAMFPFDTIKTFAQTEGSTATRESVANLVKVEGSLRLWRGVSTMLTGCIPAHAAYFSIYEHGKVVFNLDDPDEHRPLAAAACGALATIAHDSIMTPMDVIKQRMQLGFHSGIIDCFTTVSRTDGVGALFRSFPTTLIMNIPYAGIMVATNESAKKILNPSNEYNVGAFFLSGGIAGAVAAALTTPLDVVKTRLQTQSILASEAASARSVSEVKSSIRSLKCMSNRGLSMLRESKMPLSPNNFASYMSLCRYKYSGNGSNGLYNHMSRKGTTTFTSPADIKKRHHSTGGNLHEHKVIRYNGMADAIKTIYKEEGFAGFTRGLRPRLMVNAPSVAISWTAYESAKTLLTQYS